MAKITQNPDGTFNYPGVQRPVTREEAITLMKGQMAFGSGGFIVPGVQNPTEDQFKDYWTQAFRADPQMQQIYAASASEEEKEQAATARAYQLGWVPPGNSWSVDFDKDGFRTERASWGTRNRANLIRAGVAFGTLGTLSGLSGPAGAGAPGATAPAASTGAGGPAAGGVAAANSVPVTTGLGGTGGVGAGGAGGAGFWSNLGGVGWGNAAAIGGNLAGGYMNYRAQQNATNAEQEAAAQALDFTKAQYAQEREDTKGYRQVGRGALAELYGNPIAEPREIAPPYVPRQAPGQPPQSNLATLGQQQPQTVTMRAPGDRMVQVPQDKVNEALSRGAVRV